MLREFKAHRSANFFLLCYGSMNEKNLKTALKLKSWVKISHHIPGRIRLKYKLSIIAHLARFNVKDIEKSLDEITAFKNYKVNPSTGSILIEYDSELVSPLLISDLFSSDDAIVERAYYDIAELIT